MIDPKGLRGFRPDKRRSSEPDATEGREYAHAYAERVAALSMVGVACRVRLCA